MNRVEKKSIIIWILSGLIRFIIFAGVASGIYFMLSNYTFIKKSYWIVMFFLIFWLIETFVSSPFMYKNYRFSLEENRLFIRTGFLSIQESTIHFRKIQHVDIEQTVYSRLFNLHRLNVYTAGDSHRIEFIEREIAEQIRDEILTYISNVEVTEND